MRTNILITALCSFATLYSVLAQDQYLGEIKLWPINFAPNGWAFCQGQAMSISQNTALFALLGTQFGGNGQTTFNLPDLRGRFPLGVGPGTDSINNAALGQTGSPGATAPVTGSAQGSIALTAANLPLHGHPATFAGTSSSSSFNIPISVAQSPGVSVAQAGGSLSQGANSGTGMASIFAPPGSSASQVTLNGGTGSVTNTPAGTVTVAQTGGGQPYMANLPLTGATVPVKAPSYLALNYIIALEGVYPSRS